MSEPKKKESDDQLLGDSEDERSSLIQGTNTAVGLVSFLSAISFFFAGLLLTGSDVNSYTRSVSLSLLFASAFGFLFAALFYSNVSGKDRMGVADKAQAARGNIISEYFGVYGLIFATPLAIYSYSEDVLMSLVVFLFIASGISIYQIPRGKTSILERYTTNRGSILITLWLVAVAFLQLMGAFFSIDWLLYLMTAALWITIIVLAVFSWSKSENPL